MIKGCLTLPFRILATVVAAGALYLVWINRDEVKRWVHQLTAESVAGPAEAESVAALTSRATARLDSLARGRVDSILLAPAEIEALVIGEISRRAGTLVDSVSLELGDGEATLRGQIDPAQLPAGAVGPLGSWLEGRKAVEVRGPLGLLRLGTGEWRIEQVLVGRIPLPRPLWARLVSPLLPGTGSSVIFPVERWVTGIRVTPTGAVLYGGGGR